MNILILGGTSFLGRHIAQQALQRGHQLTLFHRGQTNPDLFPQAVHSHGNRDGNLQPLEGGSWDAVIDTSGYVPRVVGDSVRLLKGRADSYTFISTLSVFKDFGQSGMREDSPLATVEDESTEDVSAHYGALKVLCEQVVEEEFPGRTLVIRPGLIVGPNDPTNRFTYWPVRVAEGGEVLAPDRPDRGIQIIDVRDLSCFTLDMTERGAIGVYNATGPDQPLNMGTFLEACKAVTGSGVTYTWVPESFLLEQEVGPWMELPLWVPDNDYWRGFATFDCSKAWKAGMTHRPIEETIRDTLAWAHSVPPDPNPRAGMKPERERELLEQWHAQRQN